MEIKNIYVRKLANISSGQVFIQMSFGSKLTKSLYISNTQLYDLTSIYTPDFSFYTIVLRKCARCDDFSLLKFTEACVVSQRMVHPCDCSMCTWERAFSHREVESRRCQLSSSGLRCHGRLMCPWLSVVSSCCIFVSHLKHNNSEWSSRHHDQFQGIFITSEGHPVAFSSHPYSPPLSPRQPQLYRFVCSRHFAEMECYSVLSSVAGFFGLACFQSSSVL